MADDLHYPNLSTCKVTLTSSTVGSKAPVKLPPDCLDVLSTLSIPPPYDFSLGMSNWGVLLCVVVLWECSVV
jgi:hypothetical protein